MKLQLKRSNVLQGGAAKVPDPVDMEYGEIAINYNADDPALFLKDSNNAMVNLTSGLYSSSGGTISGAVTISGNETVTGNQTINGSSTVGTQCYVTGSVGVGMSTTPDTDIHIKRSTNSAGGLKIENTDNSGTSQVAQIELSGGNAAYSNVKLECNGNIHNIKQDSSGGLSFINGSDTRLKIDSTGDLIVYDQGSVKLSDADSSNYFGIKAPTTIASNLSFTLPATDGASGQGLVTDGSGTLSWDNLGAIIIDGGSFDSGASLVTNSQDINGGDFGS